MRTKLFLFALFLFIIPRVSAQYNYNEQCRLAYKSILELRFEEAQNHLNSIKKTEPDNLIPMLLENYIDFLKISLNEDKALFETAQSQKKIRLKEWEKGSKSNPYYRLGIAQINLQWAFTRVIFGEYITAAIEIKEAYHLLEENKKLFPDFLPTNIGLGLLHTTIGIIPEQYQWAINLFGLHGCIDQGLSEIKQVLESNKPEFQHFKPEALFVYTFLKVNLKSGKSILTELNQYYKRPEIIIYSQTSPLLQFSEAVLLAKQNNDMLLNFLESRPQNMNAEKLHFNQFMLAQAKLNKFQPEAKKLFNDYIKNYPGENYKRSAAQKMAWMAFIQGDTLEYKATMNRIPNSKETNMDADKEALKEAKKATAEYLPNLYLLKSRILFDGNYLDEALSILQQANIGSFNDSEKLELAYRKGRIYHHSNNLLQASYYYKLAIGLGEKSNSYFAGNSALKLGEIYEMYGDKIQAKKYFKKCLSINFEEYNKSIRAKAKAGLLRLDSN